MDSEKFNKFGSLLLKDEFVLSYSGYASEDVRASLMALVYWPKQDIGNCPKSCVTLGI